MQDMIGMQAHVDPQKSANRKSVYYVSFPLFQIWIDPN